MIQAVAGIAFIFFVPGFLAALLFFPDIKTAERLLLSVLLSISFYVLLGVILGFNETAKNITGGLSSGRLWLISITLSVFLAITIRLNALKSNKKRKKDR